MSARRKSELDHRLESYFATLRSSPLRETLKRRASHWQIYAAVTGSAVAMATGASAAIIAGGVRDIRLDPVASVFPLNQDFANTRNPALANAVRLAMAQQGNAAGPAVAVRTQMPSISPGGVVPLDGTESIIQPGELVTIYGNNLASGTFYWQGDFPTSLGGTRVEIDGKAAYLMYVSPSQINLQAPDDQTLGKVPVVVITAQGRATSEVTLSKFAPSFGLLSTPKGGLKYVSGVIVRADGSGAFGKGKDSYDILGPPGVSLGYPTKAAQEGDTVELFGVGFGPTNPAVPAGTKFSGRRELPARSISTSVAPMWRRLSLD